MTISINDAVYVQITEDRDATLAFLKWAGDNRIHSLRGSGGSVGPDFVSYTFPARHKAAIGKFFADRTANGSHDTK